jgi:AraC family transcriptional regulator of arabinose operon
MASERKNTPHTLPSVLVTGHFREKAGYSAWREGGTADWLLIYTAGGRGRFGYSGGEIVTAVGDVVLIRPGTLQDYGTEASAGRWELLWVHFRPPAQRMDWVEWMGWPEESPGLMRLRLGEGLRSRVRRRLLEMHRLATGGSPRREALAMNALEEVVLWCDGVNPLQAQGRLDPRVRFAMDAMCRRLEEEVTLEGLAAGASLSVSRLAHLFREEVGVSPQKFRETQRLERAKQLLAYTADSVKEVAYKVGFASAFYFSLRFKRYTGKSPRGWRAGDDDGETR